MNFDLETAGKDELLSRIQQLEREHGIPSDDPTHSSRLTELLKRAKIQPEELLRARLAAMLTW